MTPSTVRTGKRADSTMGTDIRMHALETHTVATCKSKAGRIARFALGRSLRRSPYGSPPSRLDSLTGAFSQTGDNLLPELVAKLPVGIPSSVGLPT